MTKYVITRSLTKQALPPTRQVFDTMTEAYLAIIEVTSAAVRARRAFDICWLSDDHVVLTSPTGRVLEEYKLTLEE